MCIEYPCVLSSQVANSTVTPSPKELTSTPKPFVSFHNFSTLAFPQVVMVPSSEESVSRLVVVLMTVRQHAQVSVQEWKWVVKHPTFSILVLFRCSLQSVTAFIFQVYQQWYVGFDSTITFLHKALNLWIVWPLAISKSVSNWFKFLLGIFVPGFQFLPITHMFNK
jgi:hypothetical protein